MFEANIKAVRRPFKWFQHRPNNQASILENTYCEQLGTPELMKCSSVSTRSNIFENRGIVGATLDESLNQFKLEHASNVPTKINDPFKKFQHFVMLDEYWRKYWNPFKQALRKH